MERRVAAELLPFGLRFDIQNNEEKVEIQNYVNRRRAGEKMKEICTIASPVAPLAFLNF